MRRYWFLTVCFILCFQRSTIGAIVLIPFLALWFFDVVTDKPIDWELEMQMIL